MKTTKTDFEEFKGYAEKWRKQLGLTNWAVYYKHRKTDGNYAEISLSIKDQIAAVSFGTDWNTDWRIKDSTQLERCALHEMLHLLLIHFYHHAESRYTTQEALDQSEHSIIRQLENVIL